ncbi:SdpI family protein [uncultured Mucilaginibacter sp.]|uniref:SdpI family protein n=1 Tax=uncultured Mucilaginibacter sp. TaxID=797541 RepID=UPI0025D5553E|nr:SdpI family protein [uncultured Mucilaginibacter sp.]
MKKFTLLDGAALVVWLLPVVYIWILFPTLPQTVPVHYGINGTVDRYGSKNEFLIGPVILTGVSALVYLLLKYLPAIDPKKQIKYGEVTFQKLGLGLVVFMAALNVGIAYATAHHGFPIEKLLFPVIGLLFAFIGNMMNSIKPNYFAGIRTPWTLESEDNWRATHRLAGKIWFVGGLLITIIMLILPATIATILFTAFVIIMAFIPVIYSFIYFKKHQVN